MKLNYLHHLLLLLGLCFGLTAAAQTERVEIDNVYYNLNHTTNTAEVTFYLSYNPANGDYYKGDVVIPETIDYRGIPFTVTGVAQRAFYYCTEMTSIQLPPTVETVLGSAFFNCTGLKKANIPEGVKTLSTSLFTNCSSLEEVDLPSTLTTIGTSVFSKCSSLRHIKIPPRVSEIGICAFMESGIENIELPAALYSIANKGFMSCSNLKNLSLPAQLYSIGEQCFEGCKSLEFVDMGTGLTEIDIRCFAECPKLKVAYCRNPKRVINSYTGIFFNSPVERILVPNELVAKYAANQAWNSVPDIVPLKCATPEVLCTADGLELSTATNLDHCSMKEFITYSIDVSDLKEGVADGENIASILSDLQLTYDVKATARVNGVEDSEETFVTLCWIDRNVTFYGSEDDPGHQTSAELQRAEQRPVVVKSVGGELTVSGLDDGERVTFYSVEGRLLGTATASGTTAAFSLTPGQIVVVRVGHQSFKVRVR